MHEPKTNTALSHVWANLWLLALTVGICCVLYPAVVWVIAQLCFRHQAQGSLIDAHGNPTTDEKAAVGSVLIAQPFNSPWFFQSRPSATSPSYNAAASGGSNLAASNPKLRGRVASLLGTISRYSDAYKKAHQQPDGDPTPQADLLAWYAKQSPQQRWYDWATNNPTLVQQWATGTASIQDYVQRWEDKHSSVAEDWEKDNPKATQAPAFNDLLPYFFRSYEQTYSGKWPASEAISAWAKDHAAILTRWKAANPGKGDPTDDDLTAFFPGDSAKNAGDWPSESASEWVDVGQKAVVQPTAFQDRDIQQTFFDMWYTESLKGGTFKAEDFRPVPADMVTTSGSGLDPDISLANAVYQEEEVVVPAYAEKLAKDRLGWDKIEKPTPEQIRQKQELTDKAMPEVKKHVAKAMEGLASQPMLGLTGDGPLVNVLQLNLRWQAEMANVPAP